MVPAPDRSRAVLTCAARSRTTLAPIIEAAEHLLLDLGWRTRVVPRTGPGLSLSDRRRLRRESYREVERALVVIHVPAPRRQSGARLHRELGHAVKTRRLVLLLHAIDLRESHEIEHADRDRLARLEQLTGGRLVEQLAHLPTLLPEHARRK